MTPYVVFVFQLALLLATATALAVWCGWGMARLALPPALRPYSGLLAPALGYVLVVVLGYWGVRTVSGLGPVLLLAIVLGGGLNIVAWRRTGPLRLPATAEHVPLLVLLVMTLLVGVAPLLSYGHPAIIGAGWDTENYLPTARYLERGPVSAIADAPTNPLRDINADPSRIGLTLGFSIWHGSVNLLTGSEALATFAPLLAWLRALGVLTLYVLLRTTLGLERWPALVGALWTSAGALLLWVSYFNFGMQLAAWPLIPLAVTLGIAAVEDAAARGRIAFPGIVLAGLAFAAVPITYYPALTLLAPLAVGVGIAVLAQSWGQRATLLGSAFGVALVAALFAAPTLIDYGQGFSYRYSEQLTTLGLFHFIGPTEVLGLTIFSRDATQPVPPPPPPMIGAAIVLVLMGLGIVSGPRRARWLGLVAGALAVLLWVRLVRAYPYAYMKVCAYTGWVFLVLAAAGLQALLHVMPRRLRALVALPALAVAGLLAAGQAQVVAEHWNRPGLYASELPALQEIRSLVPAGSTVTLTSDPRIRGTTAGLAAYLLDHTTVIGDVRTGYTASTAGTPGEIGEYGLLHTSEDPEPWGYEQPIWRGGSFALYRRPAQTVAHLRLGQTLAPGAIRPLALGSAYLAPSNATLPGGARRTLLLSVASLTPGALQVGSQHHQFPAGVSTVRLTHLDTPQTLELRNIGRTPLVLRYAALSRSQTETQGVTVLARPQSETHGVTVTPASLVAQATSLAHGNVVTTTLEALLPDSGPLVAALDIWDTKRGRQYGWYGMVLDVNAAPQQARIVLDLQQGQARATNAEGTELPLGTQFAGLKAGTYTARLLLGVDGLPLVTPVDLFEFVVTPDGRTQVEWTDNTPLVSASTARPVSRTDVTIAGDVGLYGYTLTSSVPRAGEEVTLVLWWHNKHAPLDERSVLVHVLDQHGERVAQADGPPALGRRPTSQWQVGEYVLDVRHIRLPEELATGRYSLGIGMYRWPSLERLPLAVAGERAPADMLHIPLHVEAAPPATMALFAQQSSDP
jgi:hypothetical protein